MSWGTQTTNSTFLSPNSLRRADTAVEVIQVPPGWLFKFGPTLRTFETRTFLRGKSITRSAMSGCRSHAFGFLVSVNACPNRFFVTPVRYPLLRLISLKSGKKGRRMVLMIFEVSVVAMDKGVSVDAAVAVSISAPIHGKIPLLIVRRLSHPFRIHFRIHRLSNALAADMPSTTQLLRAPLRCHLSWLSLRIQLRSRPPKPCRMPFLKCTHSLSSPLSQRFRLARPLPLP